MLYLKLISGKWSHLNMLTAQFTDLHLRILEVLSFDNNLSGVGMAQGVPRGIEFIPPWHLEA